MFRPRPVGTRHRRTRQADNLPAWARPIRPRHPPTCATTDVQGERPSSAARRPVPRSALRRQSRALSGASGAWIRPTLFPIRRFDLPALGRAVASPFVGAYNMATGQPGATDAYNQARQDALDAQERAAAAYPKTYLAGEIGSSLALPLGAASGGATAAARVGKSALAGSIGGAGFGAGTATSEGESPMGVGERAAGGAATGALLGGALGGAVDTASHVGRRVASVIRAGINPEREATRIAQGAFTGPGQAKAIGQRLNDQAALKAGGEADTPVPRSATLPVRRLHARRYGPRPISRPRPGSMSANLSKAATTNSHSGSPIGYGPSSAAMTAQPIGRQSRQRLGGKISRATIGPIRRQMPDTHKV